MVIPYFHAPPVPKPKAQDASSGIFPSTRWTLIGLIREGQSTMIAKALEEICGAYWYPLYVYARRFGLDETDAKDAVQDVFARLLTENRMASADSAKGRLRTFLLTILRNEIGQNRRKGQAEKRGSNVPKVSLDLTDAEGRYLHEPMSSDATPEGAFERKWALEVLETARRRLRESYVARGNAAMYDALSPALMEGERWSGHHEASRRLGMSEGALKVALHRMRKHFREQLLAEVRLTLDDSADEAELKRELAHLRGLFAR